MRLTRLPPPLALLALLGLGAGARGHDSPTPTPTPIPTGTVAGKVTLQDKEGSRPGEAAVVYVESVDRALWPKPARKKKSKGKEAAGEASAIAMKAKRFEPRVLPVVAGEEVRFPNLDPVFHNAFSLSPKNKFDLGLYKDGTAKSKVFDHPGVVRVFCNIHPAMKAFVLVLQNPWFAASDGEGSFRIPALPVGSYTLRAWHERGGEASQAIEVKAGAVTTVELELDARGYKELPHKNKFGQDYGKADAY